MEKEQKTYECETCHDTGEVSTPDYVYAGEPHMADVGTARCPDCNLPDEDEYDDQDFN
jgi:hypothetical protein